jgi:hypothetical protein
MVTMAMASLLVEKDVLAKLKANSGVTALIPAGQIYPQDAPKEPKWPFIVPQQPQGLPLNAACVRGATINFGISAFTRGRWSAPVAPAKPKLMETPRDHCAKIGDAIETCIRGARSTLGGIGAVVYSISDIVMMPDGAEPGARHFSCTVRARVLA